MKIGIITTQYASNYGALLQAYALQTYIREELNYSVETIDYYPSHYKDYWQIFSKNSNYKAVLMNMILGMHFGWVKKKKIRFIKFKIFKEQFIKCSKPFYSKEELEQEKCPYDVCICGSDQIWNVSRHRIPDPVWFLNVNGTWKNVKKISYAPSIADKITDDKKKYIKEYLRDFSAISVREDSDVEELEKIISRDVIHVCDPVFLVDKKKWENILTCNNIPQDYICCYFLNPNDEAVLAVKKIRELTGLPVIHINVNDLNKIQSCEDIRDAGPLDFIGYIKNAKYVVTNSFHCTAFSVLFNKDFYVIKKKTANARMSSLLRKVGLEDRIIGENEINKLDIGKLCIDYSEPNRKLEEFIKYSKGFLQKALKTSYEKSSIN